MRKSIFILLFALLGVLSARAYAFEVDGIYYSSISDTSVEVVSLRSTSGTVVIPSTVTYEGMSYVVTSIRSNACYYNDELTSITIPESVTSVGASAFGYCIGLTTVVWNAVACQFSIYRLEDHPFSSCENITSITFGNQVEYIPSYLCYGMNKLTSVTIQESVTFIGNMAFHSCSGLTSVTIPESVIVIGNAAFYGCSGLTSVDWNSVTCDYYGSSNGGPFSDCENITSITFGSQVEHIPSCLCYGMNKLISVTIPESVTSIGSRAFSDCTGLTSLTIPESVDTIGDFAFSGCTSISSPLYNSKVFAYMPQDYSGNYAIPSGIRLIAGGACYNCTGLASVTIPNSLTSIGNSAFSGCSGLMSIMIQEGVTSIGSSAFEGCSGLTSVEWKAVSCQDFSYNTPPFSDSKDITSITFGSKVEHIPSYLCYGMNKLRLVTIPASVTSIGGNVFGDCDGLISVTSLAKLPPYCEEENVFGSASSSEYYQTLYVPRGSKSSYESAKEWHKFSKIEEIETYTVTVLANDADMGSVVGGGNYREGEQVTLTAKANQGYHFVKWDDENTDNPRTLTVTADITLTAIFAKDKPDNPDDPDNPDNPTPNENLEADNFRVYVQGRTITLSEDRGAVQVYNMVGRCVYNGYATEIPVPQSGVYIVAVGSQRFKVLVR